MKIYKKTLTSYTNFLLMKYERFTGARTLESAPYFISVDPSSICNLKCPFCPTGIENSSNGALPVGYYRKRVLLDPQILERLLDELGEYLFIINFYNWGEPLLNKALPSMVKTAKEREIYTQIHSNLALNLSVKFIEELLDSGIDEICLSIDGITQDVYETYRRGGNISLVIKNLERLVKVRDSLGLDTTIEWGFLMFSFNHHQLREIKLLCRDLGIRFRARKAHIDPTKHPDWAPGLAANIKIMLNKPRMPMDELLYLAKTKLNERLSRNTTCIWHYSQSTVNSDGTVSPCCAVQNSQHDFGVVSPDSGGFMGVWNNSNFVRARTTCGSNNASVNNEHTTICETCSNSKLKNLYSGYEYSITKHFLELFGKSEPEYAHAFRIICSRAKFVKYFRERIMPRIMKREHDR